MPRNAIRWEVNGMNRFCWNVLTSGSPVAPQNYEGRKKLSNPVLGTFALRFFARVLAGQHGIPSPRGVLRGRCTNMMDLKPILIGNQVHLLMPEQHWALHLNSALKLPSYFHTERFHIRKAVDQKQNYIWLFVVCVKSVWNRISAWHSGWPGLP